VDSRRESSLISRRFVAAIEPRQDRGIDGTFTSCKPGIDEKYPGD
jgi:hypothetical protein